MSLKAKRKVVSSIPPMDGGTYMGVCVAVVDLGQQYKQFEKQKQGKYAEECMFIFEIPDERVEVDGEDKPRCRNAAADGNEHAQSHIDGRNRGEQAASFIGAVLLTDIAGGGIRHPARKDEVQQLYRGVGQVECTDRTLHKDVGIQRGTPDDEQSLDHLGRQEQHRIARHGIFRGQKKNPRFPSDR